MAGAEAVSPAIPASDPSPATPEPSHAAARAHNISFFASPGNYRVRTQMAVDNEPFAAYGTLWWTREGTTR